HGLSDPQQCCMVGDRMDTDIAAAHAAGFKAVLVLSGITKAIEIDPSSGHVAKPPAYPSVFPEVSAAECTPDLVVAGLSALETESEAVHGTESPCQC
ncbi:hypothetical protein KIPB_012367, partial [Kipferlia bialata]